MIQFEKYQGTGNDFILIDDRNSQFPREDLDLVRKICDRRFGIGADGLILLREHKEMDFEMIYFNPDGSQSLCGNGSRCIMQFANHLNIIGDSARFLAIDGKHEGLIENELVHIKMADVSEIKELDKDLFINTGSPHFIRFVNNLKDYQVVNKGAEIRYSQPYNKNGGTNVNFVEIIDNNRISVRTYERGIENETLSCGTGVTAVSLAMGFRGSQSPVNIETPGGDLQVSFRKIPGKGFTDIYLIGPSKFVFRGSF